MGKTLKELNLKVGDVVIYDGRDEYVVGEDKTLIFSDGKQAHYWGWDTVPNFTLKSAEIKVGEKVRLKVFDTNYDVLYIHNKDERKYVVVAYKGDIPRSYTPEQLEVVKEPVVKDRTIYTNPSMNIMGHTRNDSDTHKIVYKVVDGVPDCNSIKMEEL
jgi:hypothetical protein